MSWLDNNNNILLSQKSLDYLWEKQRVIAENIANNDTPGYKSKIVSFEEELSGNLEKFRGQESPKKREIKEAILGSGIKVDSSGAESSRMDGNNVNLDAEQVELGRAQLQYQFQIYQINDQFSRLRSVLKR